MTTFAPVKSDPWKKGLPLARPSSLWPDGFWTRLCGNEDRLNVGAGTISGCGLLMIYQQNKRQRRTSDKRGD